MSDNNKPDGQQQQQRQQKRPGQPQPPTAVKQAGQAGAAAPVAAGSPCETNTHKRVPVGHAARSQSYLPSKQPLSSIQPQPQPSGKELRAQPAPPQFQLSSQAPQQQQQPQPKRGLPLPVQQRTMAVGGGSSGGSSGARGTNAVRVAASKQAAPASATPQAQLAGAAVSSSSTGSVGSKGSSNSQQMRNISSSALSSFVRKHPFKQHQQQIITTANSNNLRQPELAKPLQQQTQRIRSSIPISDTRRELSLTRRSNSLEKQRVGKNIIPVNNIMADQAVIDKLEAGFAKLQAATPEQCHSLLKKYLTREVLDKLKTKKTAMGASLLDVAQSGFENLDSGVGIYAPDAESYTLFADLFNPIIEDYHGGFKPTDKHPQSDFGDINTLVNVDPDNQFVISTRVRCGRSLKGYPFNPCLTEAQYKEMEQKVSSTLKEMTGDLAGTYYPLTGMTKETQQQLIDDHFLFKEGDRFLQHANACRYWPTGRGIYHNAEKSFLVWVNEEDHLRIISMQKGGDLKTIYDRLIRGAKSIEAKVPFSRDDRLGFLTFCPTNLGTTIRASVHIKLPKLAADRKKLEEVASKFNLQVRGTSGEHTESVGGVYDISNKRRLGLTEYQAVREMQDGILELIKIEKSL